MLAAGAQYDCGGSWLANACGLRPLSVINREAKGLSAKVWSRWAYQQWINAYQPLDSLSAIFDEVLPLEPFSRDQEPLSREQRPISLPAFAFWSVAILNAAA